MIVDALALFLASFVVVFAFGLQQMNVNGGHTGLAFATSLVIGASSVVQFKILPGQTDALALAAYLFGSAFGIVASMRAHPALIRGLAAWRRRRAVATPTQAIADALGEKLRLALAIAGPAAVSDIERFCPVTLIGGVRWYDTGRVGAHVAVVDPEYEFEVHAVALAVRFLDASGRLIHYPLLHGVVRFKP